MQSTPLIISTVAGTLGAGGLVKLSKLYLNYRRELRDSLKYRVVELEEKVDHLQSRIEEMINMYSEKIIVLSTEKATLTVLVDTLKVENLNLKEEVRLLKTR